jgi:hypothetical protein
LQDLTGGLVSIGPGTGAVGAGGQLKTTGDAIVLQNVQNATLSQIEVLNTGAAAGSGVTITHTSATTAMDITLDGLHVDSSFDHAVHVTGSSASNLNVRLEGDTTTGTLLNNDVAVDLSGAGHFGLLVDHTTINTTGTEVAFDLAQTGGAKNADITFQTANAFHAENAQALLLSSAGTTVKTVNILVQDSTFSNTSAGTATPVVDIRGQDTTIMNTTVQGNTFTTVPTGLNYSTTADGAGVVMNLNLGGTAASGDKNTASGGLQQYFLDVTNGATFGVFDKTNTFNNTRNNGTVNPQPNAGAYQDLGTTTPPTLPTVP